MSFFEDSCERSADILSCDAQTYLAKKEIERNAYVANYNLIHPVCPRLNQLSDREMEHVLQKSESTNLKTCFTRPVDDPAQGGGWKYQFMSYVASPVQFDEVTRAKFNTRVA